jgi:hypothetical protein
MLNDRSLRRWTGTCLGSVMLGAIVLSLLDCTESDPPLYIPVPDRTFRLADSACSVVEADTTLYVKVERSCGCDSAGVWVTCSGGTAKPGEDFVAATTRLAFRRGSALESLAVHILADTLHERTEVVLVTLGPASEFYEITDPDTVEISILDDEPPGPLFTFRQAHYDAFEGQGQAHVSVICTGVTWEMGLAGVSARTVDGTARAGTDYVARSGRLVFIPSIPVGDFSVTLIDDGASEGGKTFAIELFDPSHGGLVDPPGMVTVEILDDDTPVEPATIAMPLQLDNQWTYDATVSYRSAGNYDGWTVPAVVVGTLDERVRYKGEEYLRLNFASTPSLTAAGILLRQSGDSLLFICPSDTCPATPGTWQAQLQETLPWLLADLSAVTDTTVTLFSTFSTGSGSWDSDQRTLHILGREDTAVPAGQFRQTLRVRYEREFAHSEPGYSCSGSSRMEFTLADSVGFVRMGYGSNTSGEYWTEDSCRGALVSYSLQN